MGMMTRRFMLGCEKYIDDLRSKGKDQLSDNQVHLDFSV